MDPTKRIFTDFRSDSVAASGAMSRIQRPVSRSQTSYAAAERYFSQTLPQARSTRTPLNQPFHHDADKDLDEFDRRLLAEGAQTYNYHLPQASTRTALSRPPQTPVMSNTDTLTTSSFGGHRNTMTLQRPTSSPCQPMTSPTTHVLRNRQKSKTNPPRGLSLLLEQPHASQDERSQIDCPEHRSLPNSMPSHTLPVIQGIQLVPSTALPDQLRSVFKFEIFNAVQSKCFAHAFKTDDNLVVSAPTGSGKTAIMELAICRIMGESRGTDFKVVYQAPTKSLCSERFGDWQAKFGALNVQCAELTGDTEQKDLRNVQSANIIITTPEKWDSVTRKWKDHAKLIELVKLFLVDEVHILKEWRGATLEAVVSRMKSVASSVRFVALSATVPNSEDIAAWLGKNCTCPHLPATREVFGETFRPVELKKHVYGFEARGNDFVFESMLTQRLPDIISQHGHGKPVMIFCSTRKSSIATAKALAGTWSTSNPAHRLWRGPTRPLSFTCSELRVTSVAGVAFHHAGVDPVDRRAVEQAFLHGQINVICSTSTLAVGVNLPCYLVILKGTTAWTANGFQEYADLEVMQMLGRAGRPQFETSACAVILTRKEKVTRYQKMVTGEEVLESCLHQNLIEHLNAEIGLGTVYDLVTAKQWLGSTFLSVRMRKNPAHYQLNEVLHTPGDDGLLDQLCRKDVALLTEAGLVNEEPRLTLTEFGDAMARYYVNFDTMKSFVRLPPRAKMSEILSMLAGAKEFRDVRMLASERSFYREINKAPEIKYPIKVDIALQEHKVLLLIQAELGNVAIPDAENHRKHHQQHRLDKVTVFIHANRLIRCIIDCQIHRKDAVSVRNALELSRSLAAHVWDNTASQLRQVEGLGEVAVRKLASASINSIDTLINTEPCRIGLILGKNPPYGQTLLKKLESFPDLRVSIKETSRKTKGGKGATINVVAQIGFLNNTAPLVYNRRLIYVCFLAETSHGELIDFRRCSAKTLQGGEEIFLSVQLSKPTSHIKCYVMCDEVAGTCKYAELHLTDIPDSVYPRQQSVQTTHSAVPAENRRNGRPVSTRDNEFDDGGIDDQDLLSVEAKGSKIDVIEDIEDILSAENKKKHLKTSKGPASGGIQAKHETDDDTEVSTFREPARLPNGRWTCQHDCNERHKSCKHKCCREGVARPKRRPKEEPKIKHEDRTQTKITSLTSTNQKGRKSGQEALRPEKLHDPVGKNDATERVRKLSTSHPAAKRPKLSTAQNRKKLDQELSLQGGKSGAENTRPSMEDETTKPDEEKPEASTGGLDDTLFHFSDDSMDESGCDRVTSGITTAAKGVDLDAPGPFGAEPCPVDDGPDGLLMSQLDFGGFEPPLKHVALSDVQSSGESLFITGNTSSPVKQCTQGEPTFQAEEAFLDTLVGFGECMTNDVETEESMDQTASAEENAMLTSSEASSNPNIDSLEESRRQDVRGAAGEAVSNGFIVETEEERRIRLYEEDQKKKWEGIDQWLYAEYHDYVEIV
ncbi:ATP-dependent DNA helicase MER3 [Exophiala sideris]|nr:ATP-dependent DNA helicase MER3 [Exophiala sideris]